MGFALVTRPKDVIFLKTYVEAAAEQVLEKIMFTALQIKNKQHLRNFEQKRLNIQDWHAHSYKNAFKPSQCIALLFGIPGIDV